MYFLQGIKRWNSLKYTIWNIYRTLYIHVHFINLKCSVAIFRPKGTTANTTKFEACSMPSKVTWRIYYILCIVENFRKISSCQLKSIPCFPSLITLHWMKTGMTDFSWQTCLTCQVLNVGCEKVCCVIIFQKNYILLIQTTAKIFHNILGSSTSSYFIRNEIKC